MISSIARPNCYIIINAETGGTAEEVARGKISEWTPGRSKSSDTLALAAYDELLDLQASQDNRYISKGTSTQEAITAILQDWGIPIGSYAGPSVSHAKTTFKNKNISDIIIELLDTAKKQTGIDCVMRASKGSVSVVQKGSNSEIYHFEEGKNLISTKYKLSTSDLVTVVKVVANEQSKNGGKKGDTKTTEKEEKRQVVEAILQGAIEYGIRQKIYVRDDDDNLSAATAAARQILSEEGVPKETITISCPDVPFIRKGDKIHVSMRVYIGHAIVEAIQHNASSRTMSITIKRLEGWGIGESDTHETPNTRVTDYTASFTSHDTGSSESTGSGKYQVGDTVTFEGGDHYYSSDASSPRGGTRTSGKAQITQIAKGAAHPYHLIGGKYCSVGGNCNVYGWVDTGTFK